MFSLNKKSYNLKPWHITTKIFAMQTLSKPYWFIRQLFFRAFLAKRSTVDVWHCSGYASSSKYTKVLIMLLVLNMTGFWTYQWCSGVVVITNAQLHLTKLKLRFSAGSNPARVVSEIRNGEDLWQRSRLEIRLNIFRRSTIPTDHNFRGNLLKNHFRHLKLYSIPPSWLARGRSHMSNF